MTEVKKPRATPIPQGYDRILSGSLKLTLKERVDIKNALDASIQAEVKQIQANAAEAVKLLNGQAT